MKKLIGLTLFVAAISLFTSCKKKEEDPTPVATTTNTPTPPAVNQPSTTAPSLIPGTNTTLSIYTGVANEDYLNLADGVVDPQGDDWSITSVTSSNTNVATVAIDDDQVLYYVGIAAGTATLSVTVADVDGNSNVITLTLTVAIQPAPSPTPTLNANVTTSFNLVVGQVLNWDLSDKVTDAQGDAWTVTNVEVGSQSVATASIGANEQTIIFTALSAGTSTILISLTDKPGNRRGFYATVNVQAPASPGGATQLP